MAGLLFGLLFVMAVLACYGAISAELEPEVAVFECEEYQDGKLVDTFYLSPEENAQLLQQWQQQWDDLEKRQQLEDEFANQAMHQQLEQDRNREIEQELIEIEIDQLLRELGDLGSALSDSHTSQHGNSFDEYLDALLEF